MTDMHRIPSLYTEIQEMLAVKLLWIINSNNLGAQEALL